MFVLSPCDHYAPSFLVLFCKNFHRSVNQFCKAFLLILHEMCITIHGKRWRGEMTMMMSRILLLMVSCFESSDARPKVVQGFICSSLLSFSSSLPSWRSLSFFFLSSPWISTPISSSRLISQLFSLSSSHSSHFTICTPSHLLHIISCEENNQQHEEQRRFLFSLSLCIQLLTILE